MTSSGKILNLKFIDLPIGCYYAAFKKDRTLCYEYYSEFLLNDDVYKIGDFAVVNAVVDIEVAKFICIYSTHERKVEVVVRKYQFARNLRSQLKTEGCTEFDEENEVVEDFTKDYIIKAEQIVKKCYLIIAHPDDSANVIKKSGLDPSSYFCCRYTLKSDGLFPFFSTSQNILGENNFKSPSTKLDIAKKQKRKAGAENVPFTTHLEDCNFKGTQDKMRSPTNPNKNIKISECSINISSPIQRNLVKRNLNESFGNSPSQTDKSILNYSIVSDEDTDNPFVLKLKVSEKNKMPVIVLKKFNDDDSFQELRLKQKKSQKQAEHSPVRKSSRVKQRKSYADYISPVKSTPIKRAAARRDIKNEEKIWNENNTSVKKSSRKEETSRTEALETPTKSSLQYEDYRVGIRPIRTPKRYQGEVEAPYVKKLNVEASVRRSLRLTGDEHKEAKRTTTSSISSRKNKQHKSTASDEEENETNIRTPEKGINLDESMRRSILKVKLNINGFEEKRTLGSTSSKRQRRTPKKFCSDTSSDDEGIASSKTKTTNRVNLDESVRSSISKSSLNINKLEEKMASNLLGGTPSKRQRRATKRFSFGSSSDDEWISSSKTKMTNSSSLTTPRTLKTRAKKIDMAEYVPKTPKSKKYINTPKSLTKQTSKITVNQTPKTPKNRAKLIRDGVITPSMQSRSKAVQGDSTPLMRARSQLHVSYVPTALPCREKEYCDVFSFLEGKLLDGCGGCMYISGVPGTGKTATVTCVINNLLKNDDVPKFSYVSVNGMRLTEPRQCYVEIMKQLTGKTVPWEQAQSMLDERFTKSRKLAPVVMLIDELDILCTKRQDVVYNLLDWPTKAKNQLIVVTIANTMDLPERLLMNRVTSRLGLTRLTFQPYTYKQLQEIVTKRLTGTNSFNPDAIQFVARKVASVSGDARRALDICRRAAEIAEAEGKTQLVSMNHVNEALNAMITQPKVRAIKNCSQLEQLILQSIVAEVERTGVEETTVADVFKMLVSCSAIDGFRMVSSTNALFAVSRLSACRLILTDQKCNDINQRIILNISVDDVYYALKRD